MKYSKRYSRVAVKKAEALCLTLGVSVSVECVAAMHDMIECGFVDWRA